MPTPGSDSGLGPAVKQVSEHASALARLEVELATLELKRKVAVLGIGIGLLVGAAVLALYGLGFGLASAASGLSNVVDMWLALLIVAGALFLVVAILALVGISSLKKATPPVPEQAIDEAKKTADALRSNGAH
jgi:hypothetical protein